MSEPALWFQELVRFYRELPRGLGGQSWVQTGVFFGFFFVVVWALERAYGTRTQNYLSRNFLHDLTYWSYERSGLGYFLFLAVPIAALSTQLAAFSPAPLSHLPFALKVVIFILLNDFLYYWMHRALHRFKFLWAFHSIHHSQERMTFVTGGRFHPIETFATNFVVVIPAILLGVNGVLTMALMLVLTFQAEIEHSRIPWRFGPFGRILVSPVFHSYHHSTEARYHDKHFGQTFAIWDHLFGTAIEPGTPPPTRFGVDDVKPVTFLDTLVTPFHLLHRYYGRHTRHEASR